MKPDQRLRGAVSDTSVGHERQQTRNNARAASEDIRRWIEVDRSNSAGEFRCPAIDQPLTREKVVLNTVLRDTRHAICGIVGI